LRTIIAERNKSSGVTEALVVTTKRATFAGGMVRSVEVEADLYDASSMTLLWQYKYENKNATNTITPDLVQDVMASLRTSGFVK
jgi:hypothetical protein